MSKKQILGVVLLVLFGMSVLGGFINGTFANLGNQNMGYYVGLFGTMAAMLVGGLLCLKGKK